jgi:uncharacterized protein (TIGR02996 family)
VPEICPTCRSDNLHGAKFGFGDVSVYEYYCKSCGLAEYRRTTDRDFDEWYARWHEAEVEVEDEDEDEVSATAPDLQTVIAAPDRDSPRLNYASAIARARPERAEFIRLQVERARAERLGGALRSVPSEREAELRRRFGTDWGRYVAPLARPYASDAGYRGYEFERGFIAELRTDPDMVADPREYLFKSAPLEHLDLTPDGPVLDALAYPRVAQIRSFGLRELNLGDDDMVVLARDARLDRCEWLDLRSNRIAAKGVAALAASPRIRSIPVVLLESNPCDLDTLVAELEEVHGWIPWLHLPPAAALPDRYHAANVSYVDDGLRYAGVVTEKATRYFIVGARPVRLVPRPDGGLGVEAIDWETGEMVRATQYLSRVIHGDNEVDEVSEIEWHRAVAEIRERLKT